MNRAYSLLSFALLLSVAGCGQSASTEGTTSRTITAVTWDVNRQPVIDVRRVVVSPDSVNVDPGCGSNDLKLSDEPLVIWPVDMALAPKIMHSTSNMLCLADPGDTEAVSLERFAYPVGVGQTWAHHVVSYMSASERGGFFNDGQEPGIAAFDFRFDVNEYQNVPTQYQTANGVEFDLAVNAVCTPGASLQCSGTALQHCDGWGQWQTSVDCASKGSGWQCNAATHSCDCPLPSASTCSSNSCGTINVGNACGIATVDCGGCQGFDQTCVRNQCKVVSCHCAKGFVCDPDGACIRI